MVFRNVNNGFKIQAVGEEQPRSQGLLLLGQLSRRGPWELGWGTYCIWFCNLLYLVVVYCYVEALISVWRYFLLHKYKINFISVRWRFHKCPLSALERWPSYREYSYSRMTGKWQGPTPGVRFREGRLIEVSIRRELTVFLNGMRGSCGF